MRNVFLFIRRYFVFFSFLVLQVVSLLFLFNYNRFHRAKGLGFASEVTGWVNSKYNGFEDYLYLKAENKRLNKFNDSLLNLSRANFMRVDTTVREFRDSTAYDTAGLFRRFLLREATVVYTSVSSQNNYIQLNRGSLHGIKDNMGVVSSGGAVVGVIVNVSPHYSMAMSLLHVQNSTSASLKRSSEFGTVDWDAEDPRYVFLRRLPKSIDVKLGDTVLTSSYSFTVPAGYMIGTVADIRVDNKTGMYVLKLKTAADFYRLQQVHIIENLQGTEQQKLLEDTRQQMRDSKSGSR